LLTNKPLIRSGREETYTPGKDTGRYWDAGASNVHWLIVTDDQVEEGIKQTLELVQAEGVFIEGTSFLKYLDVDFAVMAARPGGGKIKASARKALVKSEAIYLFDDSQGDGGRARGEYDSWRRAAVDLELLNALPVFTSADLGQMVAHIRAIHTAALAGC
jgi:hypothetical protein